jgi:hypothetical protein
LNAHDLARIRDSQGWRRDRTEAFDTADGPVIVKGQRGWRGGAAYRALNALARIADSRVLQAVPVHGGAASQEVEVRRLRALHAAGAKVPRVLHVEPEFFVMERAEGRNLAQVLNDKPADAIGLWQRGLEAVRAVHARGEYLSQAQARNFIVSPGGLVAIDFEDDPLEVMTLAEAQAHDWLIYLLSTVWMLDDRALLLSMWERFAPAGCGLWRDLLLKTTRRLGWMRHLPSERKPWGRDIVSAQAVAAFLVDWRRRSG